MRSSLPATAVLLAALVAAVAAGAANEPSAFGHARRGSLSVVSGVIVEPKLVDLRGVWLDGKLPCRATRTLEVSIEIGYTPRSGKAVRATRRGSFSDPNCAEGGPNVGFTLSARKLKLACPSGAWKPGLYSFATRTLERRSGLAAVASLSWVKNGSC